MFVSAGGGEGLRGQSQGLVVNLAGNPNWIGDTDHFWYTNAVKGGTQFILVDAVAGAKKPAFDQQKLAVAISAVTGHQYTALALPFAPPAGGRGERVERGYAGGPWPQPIWCSTNPGCNPGRRRAGAVGGRYALHSEPGEPAVVTIGL